MKSEWIKIGEFPDLNFLAVVETRLKDAGIEYFILDDSIASAQPYGRIIPARLMVPADRAEEAVQLLN
jgi:hypothetical protein